MDDSKLSSVVSLASKLCARLEFSSFFPLRMCDNLNDSTPPIDVPEADIPEL